MVKKGTSEKDKRIQAYTPPPVVTDEEAEGKNPQGSTEQTPAWASGIQTALDTNNKVKTQAALGEMSADELEAAARLAMDANEWSAMSTLLSLAARKRAEKAGGGEIYQVGNKLVKVNADGTTTVIHDSAATSDKSMSEYEKASLDLDRMKADQSATNSRAGDIISLINNSKSTYQRALDRAIPEGSEYAPGFEPGGAMDVSYQRLGLPYSPLKQTAHVPVEKFSPDNAWAQAMQAWAVANAGGKNSRPFESSASTSTTGADRLPYDSVNAIKSEQMGRESGIPVANTGNYQDDFIANNLPYAVWASTQTGIPTETILAMTANETGWGKASQEAPFGIKDTSGGGQQLRTIEGADSHPDTASFMQGNNLAEHYGYLVDEMNSDRWKGASRKNPMDFVSYLTGGNPGGFKWGEASNYGDSILSLNREIASRLYDKGTFGKWASAASRSQQGLLPMDVTLPYWPNDLEKPYKDPIPDWGAW